MTTGVTICIVTPVFYIVYSATISGIVIMHPSVVATLIALA